MTLQIVGGGAEAYEGGNGVVNKSLNRKSSTVKSKKSVRSEANLQSSNSVFTKRGNVGAVRIVRSRKLSDASEDPHQIQTMVPRLNPC